MFGELLRNSGLFLYRHCFFHDKGICQYCHYPFSYAWTAYSRQVHVDEYTSRLYKSLRPKNGESPYHESPAFFGYQCGNTHQQGCLTDDIKVRLHSCKHGMTCSTLDAPNVVHITPILSYSPEGQVIKEMGAGGGGQDLVQDFALNDENLKATKIWCQTSIVPLEQRKMTLRHIAQIEGSEIRTVSWATITAREYGEVDLIKILRNFAEYVDQKEDSERNPESVTRTWSNYGQKLSKNIVH